MIFRKAAADPSRRNSLMSAMGRKQTLAIGLSPGRRRGAIVEFARPRSKSRGIIASLDVPRKYGPGRAYLLPRSLPSTERHAKQCLSFLS